MKLLVILNFVTVLVSMVSIYLITSLPKKIAPLVAQLVVAAMKAGVKP
jgi:threonine/homoserine efflux transporter RhtA